MGIDPHGGPPYTEPTWQEARDIFAEMIGYDAASRAERAGRPGLYAAPSILAWQDERLLLIDVGICPDGEVLAIVVDVRDGILWTGGPVGEVLESGYWEQYEGSPADWAVVAPLLDGLPDDLGQWESWFSDAMAAEERADWPTDEQLRAEIRAKWADATDEQIAAQIGLIRSTLG